MIWVMKLVFWGICKDEPDVPILKLFCVTRFVEVEIKYITFPRWNYDNCEDVEDEEGWDVDEDGNIDSEAIWNQLFGGGLNSSYVVINDW